jgi:sugar lactone lactonase YvrE
VVFSPGYATNGHFYVDYTDASNSVVISRFTISANPNVGDTNSEQRILTIPKPYNNHNGGQLVFGPDGYLYVGVGDGGNEGDPLNNGQTTTNLLGKILRLDVEGVTQPYGIPQTNPFVGNPAYRPEIWAYGLRNPWRFTFDRLTGDLYIGDVGQNTYEEIDFEPAGDLGGENYGWRLFEGDYPYNLPAGANTNNLTWPVAEYTHVNNNCAVVGGNVYRNTIYPRMYGMYFFGDYCTGAIWGLTNQGGIWTTNQLYTINDSISSFGEDDAGNLYVARIYSGVVCQIQDLGAADAPQFSPNGGTFNNTTNVTITCSTPSATIHYTTNGINPGIGDPTITSGGSVGIVTSCVLKAAGFKIGQPTSQVSSAAFTLVVATPTISPPGGLVTNAQQVTISCATTGATIYYTLDGSTPTTNSPVYATSLLINPNTTVKAKAFASGFSASAVANVFFALILAENSTVSLVAGDGTAGYIDGGATTSRFHSVSAICVDASNNVFVADTGNDVLRRITPTGTVSTFANGFVGPVGVCVASNLNLYLTDTFSHTVRQITPSGVVSTYAGNQVVGCVAGPRLSASFYALNAIATDGSTNLYVTDNGLIDLITPGPSGAVREIVGCCFSGTGCNGLGGFLFIASDSSGNVFLSDSQGNRIDRLSSNGVVSTFVGSPTGGAGFADGDGSEALFTSPKGLAFDLEGNLIVADGGNARIRRITPDGHVTTIAGNGAIGYVEGNGSAAEFSNPYAVAVDTCGTIYIADRDNQRIRKIVVPPALSVLTPADLSYVTNDAVIVSGKTSGSCNVQSVMVNGVAVATADNFKNWTATISGLAVGTNTLVAIETDNLNNTATNQLRVIYASGSFDGNGDGLPDAWQIRYFGCVSCSNAAPGFDADGDGASNLQEFLAGTDPTNSASAFQILSIAEEGSDLRVIWMTGIGRTNALQSTAGNSNGNYDTNAFVDVFVVTNTLSTTTNYLDAGAATNSPIRYYRVRLVP